ncbi:putative acetyltransferase [Chishuiella changwenlii]|uniref:N-acetyltransferase n=1 Tax=Chishuiella changwenlii TaxID=1434701 RepID=A0A1M6X212_9FLAO|nr:GNAT family N-acetyltransferase [Chishuiella changwenlii]GGE98419.1 N-acetyltransferase [Chishuiella changwenlii]SHK99845.1 putative acetyltransferase [Chishuiella changwenlii]
MIIRRIRLEDNAAMANILRTSLEEFNLNIPGTAYFDESTDRLFQSFQIDNSAYFVAEENGEIIGGAGIYPTKGLPNDTVELVKMYMSSASRGKGIGKMLMLECIAFAKQSGYNNIYLETLPELSAAVSAYEKLGFISLNERLGDTGHFSCTIWMNLEL